MAWAQTFVLYPYLSRPPNQVIRFPPGPKRPDRSALQCGLTSGAAGVNLLLDGALQCSCACRIPSAQPSGRHAVFHSPATPLRRRGVCGTSAANRSHRLRHSGRRMLQRMQPVKNQQARRSIGSLPRANRRLPPLAGAARAHHTSSMRFMPRRADPSPTAMSSFTAARALDRRSDPTSGSSASIARYPLLEILIFDHPDLPYPVLPVLHDPNMGL